jgi:predicted  nucleic acid-binding Zn-ribbon protein
MDPLSAIGLVSGVITFIDFGYKVISAATEVHASATGSTAANKHIEFLNTRMEAVASDLAVAKSTRGMSADTQRMSELAGQCLELSTDLKKLLNKLRTNNPKSKRQVLSTIVKNVMKKDQKKELEARLDQCRQQLHLQLSHTTRLVTIWFPRKYMRKFVLRSSLIHLMLQTRHSQSFR